jgi:predicted phage baseplate assembly protein
MTKPSEVCRDKSVRRREIRNHTNAAGEHDLNGIDYLEVDEKQTTLTVYFLAHVPEGITRENVRIDGGRRISNIKVEWIDRCDPKDPRVDGCLRVHVDRPGDFSTYTLRLVKTNAQGRPGNESLEGFDPLYAQLDFSFKASCPSDLDCAPQDKCPPAQLNEPEINYLAKDYASFRQLILDRLSLIMPDWKERHVPDLGIALVELLAYVGDHLSYYQDAVATEAYLDTARERISVRRHVRLVDYQMHEGCNARAWVYVETDDDGPLGLLENIYFLSSNKSVLAPILSPDDLRNIPFSDYEVFEPIIVKPNQPLQFYKAHNRILFYTWRERECCLPRGATTATLLDEWFDSADSKPADTASYYPNESAPAPYREVEEPSPSGKSKKQAGPRTKDDGYVVEPCDQPPPAPRVRRLQLKAGDVLIFEEVLGPVTGEQADADPTHRHVVRLTKVDIDVDPLSDQPVVKIEWANEDALPFALCISTIGRAPDCLYLEDVSVAHGNVLLVDHGRRVYAPETWTVPVEQEQDAGCWAEGEPRETFLRAGALPSPKLRLAPLTYRVTFPAPSTVARQQASLLLQLMAAVRARVEQLWREARDGRSLNEDEVAEIRKIFGPDVLRSTHKNRRPLSCDEQAQALGQLLEHEERLLRKKARRVKTLAARARSGYVLLQTEEQEIAEMFGERVAARIGINGTTLLGPASLALTQDPREALPCVSLLQQLAEPSSRQGAESTNEGSATWLPQSDLLQSDAQDRHFVVEIDNDGRAHLRFGEGNTGRAPIADTSLTATYRVGNGSRGNVGAGAISSIAFRNTSVSGSNLRVRNPLPARGGIDPEPLAEVKLFAPGTFRRRLERAVTSNDYARLTERNSTAKVQRAAAAPLRWTGSWYEVRVAIDPFGSEELDQNLREAVDGSLYRYRRIGHDLRILPATYVSLDLALTVCVLPHYLRARVEAELLDLFSNRNLPASRRGFFQPDNLSFGEGIFLSKLVAVAQGVTGVESVKVTRLQRLYEGPNHEIENGLLPLGHLEVARLDNDRSFPEHGRLELDVRGGR